MCAILIKLTKILNSFSSRDSSIFTSFKASSIVIPDLTNLNNKRKTFIFVILKAKLSEVQKLILALIDDLLETVLKAISSSAYSKENGLPSSFSFKIFILTPLIINSSHIGSSEFFEREVVKFFFRYFL